MTLNNHLLQIKNLKKWFPVEKGLFSSLLGSKSIKYIKAIDGVNLNINKGEILGLAGESGCGKTTTGMTILKLYEPSSGEIFFDGSSISKLKSAGLRKYRREMQMIFQDPYQSLNPRFPIFDTIKEPLDIHGIGKDEDRTKKVLEALEKAELTPPEDFMEVYPHQLSGGQRQRVMIAKAIVLEPKFIVADEPVSMLDVSIRAGILNLLRKFANEMDLGILYISHDLSTIKYICNRTAVMYLGRVVEIGPTENILRRPLHPYVRALISAVPVPDPFYQRKRVDIIGEPRGISDLFEGCRFAPRCPRSSERCQKVEPELIDLGQGHMVACHET